jgi:hypothetical protein
VVPGYVSLLLLGGLAPRHFPGSSASRRLGVAIEKPSRSLGWVEINAEEHHGIPLPFVDVGVFLVRLCTFRGISSV